MGLTHLIDIYSRKGKDFIEKLFSTYVTVNEKMDGSAFIMEKNPRSNRIEYFKKSSTKPIDKIDRILAKYYEPAIKHFDSLDFNTRNKIPAGWVFGFEYFVDNKPVEIEYDEIPENHLMLSYIHIKDEAGKIVKTIQEKKDLDNWARVLKVSPPPIIFQGIINDDQKIKILEFLDTPFDKLVEKFKTKSFVEYIIALLNPKMTRTALNKDLSKPIEGTVFRFGLEEDEDVISAKMVDPVFTEVAREKSKTKISKKPNDTYNLTVLEMMNFIDMLNLKRFVPVGRSFEDKYISFICSAFNTFVKEDGDQYKDLDFDVPEYMKKDYFGIGIDFIPNLETRRLIVENPSFEQLFKIMLAVFRKKKKKTSPLFTKELVLKFNSTVDAIYDHITKMNVNESEIPTYGEFRDSDFKIEEEEDEEEEMNKETKPKIGVPTLKKGKKKVNIIVGRFQPFHNGHLKMAEILHQKNKLPVVLVVVHPGHNKSKKSPFDKSFMNSLLSGLSLDSGGIIIGHVFSNDGFINNIVEALRPEYEPALWGAGDDRFMDYLKKLEHNTRTENKLNIDVELVKTPRGFSGTEAREAIENDDFAAFTRLVPKSLQIQWLNLKNNISESSKLLESLNDNLGFYGPLGDSLTELHLQNAGYIRNVDDAAVANKLYKGVGRKLQSLPYCRKIEEVIKGKSMLDNDIKSESDCVMPNYSLAERSKISRKFDDHLMEEELSLGELEIISSAIRKVKLPNEILEGKGFYSFNWDELLNGKIDPNSLAKFFRFKLDESSEGKSELPLALLFENGELINKRIKNKNGIEIESESGGDILINKIKYEIKSGNAWKLGGAKGFTGGSLLKLKKEIQDRTDFDILEGLDIKKDSDRLQFNFKNDNCWPGMIPRIKNKTGLIEAFVNYFCERWTAPDEGGIRNYPHLVKELRNFFTEWVITGGHRDGFHPLALINAKYYQLVENFGGIISTKKDSSATIFINPANITIEEFKSAIKIDPINWDHFSTGKMFQIKQI